MSKDIHKRIENQVNGLEFLDLFNVKGRVMQIEKVLINDRLRVSKVSSKFRIPTIYNFAVICP